MISEKLRNLRLTDFVTKNHSLIFLLLLLIFFFPLMFIARYNFPSGDDFPAFLQAQKLGTLGATNFWYFNWSGRYTSFFLQSFLAAHTDWLTAYKIVPIVLYTVGFASLFYLVRVFFARQLSNQTLLSFSIAAFIFLVSITPDIATGYYWLPTNLQYLGAVFLTLFILALFIRFNRKISPLSQGLLAASILVLTLVLAGLNEISILFFIAAFGFINLYYLVKEKRIHFLAAAVLLVGTAAGAASLFSPGNAVRAAKGGAAVSSSLTEIIGGAIGVGVYLLAEIFAATPILIVTILYLYFLARNKDKLEKFFAAFSNVSWLWIGAYLLCSIVFVNAAIFKAVGVNSLTYRIQNVYAYNIVIIWFFLVTVFAANFRTRILEHSIPRFAALGLAVFTLLYFVFGFDLELTRKNVAAESNIIQKGFSTIETKSIYTNAYLDILSGRAWRFKQINESRTQRIRNSEGETVEIQLYSFSPQTIFIQDVNHPFGIPEAMSEAFSGKVKQFNYIETGAPSPLKEKF